MVRKLRSLGKLTVKNLNQENENKETDTIWEVNEKKNKECRVL